MSKLYDLEFLTADGESSFVKLQGIYTFDMESSAIQVDTFCVHGGPDGYITGIRGKVQCLPEEDFEKGETDLQKQVMIKDKCYLRFPTLPFIPKEPYDVIATDYDTFALVSGAKDKSFIQVITYLIENDLIWRISMCVRIASNHLLSLLVILNFRLN